MGLYPNGQPAEIFVRMAKEGSTIAGLMECFGAVASVALRHGVPPSQPSQICDQSPKFFITHVLASISLYPLKMDRLLILGCRSQVDGSTRHRKGRRV